jgi:hypothetical protein
LRGSTKRPAAHEEPPALSPNTGAVHFCHGENDDELAKRPAAREESPAFFVHPDAVSADQRKQSGDDDALLFCAMGSAPGLRIWPRLNCVPIIIALCW